MIDISYKEIADKFIERDNNAVAQFNIYNSVYSESGRLLFLEGRVKDLCDVVIVLLDKLEEQNKEITSE